jgi:putative FmdB family regulatory protein
MPLYPYRCDQCGLEWEVSRPMSKASDPANCPMDGAAGVRIFTAPVRLTSRGQDAPPAPPAPAQQPATGGWSHFGHSHGTGVGGQSHGPPRRPPAT